MTKRQMVAVAAPALAMALAACGSSSPTSKSTSSTPAAVLTMPNPAQAAPASGPVTLQRIFAAATHTATANTLHLKWSASINTGTTSQVTLEGSTDGQAQTGIVALSSSQGDLTAAFRGQDVWLRSASPSFTSALPHGKQWVHATPVELEALGLKQPLAPALIDLNLLNGIRPRSLSQKGQGPGAAAFFWSLPLAISHTAPALRAQLAKAVSLTGGPFLETGSVSLGSDGTIRSVAFDATALGTQQFDLKLSLQISGVGVPVTISAPPSGQVVALSAVPPVSRFLASFKAP